ncbi:hypothetical protein THAOC_14482 [Thalassiosira oceanica]|uniref:Uncharacterized protein n=1 Tax=Thalassiosira oceanica TaxID=159749 RepID=K0SF83_THAOC|nr:hypothetical protein THAOC_14482 [Thalassiosira oceanica]|mmetsp:Transcript_5483/g.11661  ORF Transcript_5483/g.11661 Transcript_5483/m.11661 type:complete len:93 (+) Transcript_5483:57-335(+)|eukprot:EJK64753.1 hypothetical protein THAOC_14482 [Thalassiosira oceanica]
MYRRTARVLLATQRTRIRDPRKAKQIRVSAAVTRAEEERHPPAPTPSPHQQQMLPFEPNQQSQQSMGLGSYAIAGAGMALGFTLVGALFGGL